MDNFHKIKGKAITRVKVSNKPLQDTLSPGQIWPFITLNAVKLIRKGWPSLEVVDYKYHEAPKYIPGLYIATLITRPESNHPFIIFAMANKPYIYLLTPFGKARDQIDINDYMVLADSRFISEMTRAEYYAIFVMLAEMVNIRRRELIESDRYSLLKCENIKQCMVRYRTLTRKRGGSPNEKAKEMKQWVVYYEKKAAVFLTKYFRLLEDRNYDEAWRFLKGNKGSYFGRQRLNTFFVQSSSIIGHLEIFISIYELMHRIIDLIIESSATK
jgi:hypothetical protein